MSDKPREWFIDPDGLFARDMRAVFIAERHATRLWGGVHVIEYSAYETAIRERDEAIHAMNDAHDSLRKSGEQDKQLRDEARKESAHRLRLYEFEANAKADAWLAYSLLEEERDELRDAVEFKEQDIVILAKERDEARIALHRLKSAPIVEDLMKALDQARSEANSHYRAQVEERARSQKLVEWSRKYMLSSGADFAAEIELIKVLNEYEKGKE